MVTALLLLVLAGCTSTQAGPVSASPSPAALSFRGSGFAACPAPVGAAPSDSPLADVSALPCMDGSGGTVRLGAPTGRPTVLNLWGSWCSPCGDEMPAFVRLAASSGDRVTVVGVNTADSASNAVAAARQLAVRFANVYDRDQRVRRALRVSALPATAFVTATGEVRYVYRGTPLGDADLAALIKRYLEVDVE